MKQINKKQKKHPRDIKVKFNSNPLTNLAIITGISVILAGIYFKIKNISSSGVTMGKYGKPYGTGTLDGDGILFCGIVMLLLGLAISIDIKKPNQPEL